MKTKQLALIIVFTALTLVLGQLVRVPAPYIPFLYYQIWEIPIVIAFILISPLAGLLISVLNAIVLIAIFPGNLPTGPIYNLAAVLTMQLGILVVELIFKKVYNNKNKQTDLVYSAKWIAAATAMGITTRVAGMTLVNFIGLPQPPPIGFSYPLVAVIAALPLIAVFNATLALYTIPAAYLIANRLRKYLRL